MAKAGSSTVKIAATLARKKGVIISRKTVAAVLKGGRKPLAWLPVTRAKQLREANKIDRVMFCQQHRMDGWHNVVFIDSKYLYVHWDEARGVRFWWQDASKPKVVSKKSNLKVFHFYGAVALGHKSKLVFVPPTKGALGLDSQKKVTFKSCHFVAAMNVLSDEFKRWFPDGTEYKVVFDHAKQHTSKLSTKGLAAMNVPVMSDFSCPVLGSECD